MASELEKELTTILADIRDRRGRLRSDHQTTFEKESLTVQSDAHLADIQEILKSYGVVGMQSMLDQAEVQFMDISDFSDYATMMNHVKTAEREFMKLPSAIRGQFNHDVFTWLDSAHDERRAPSPRELREREGDPQEDPPVPLVEPVAPATQPTGRE